MQIKLLKSIFHCESFILDDTHTFLGIENIKLSIISDDIAIQAIFLAASNKSSLVL